MDGSNTVFIGTASGVVKARTIKRLPPGERWTGNLLDEALGSELTPNVMEDWGGRVGIRAPVLQPHAAVPSLPLAPEVRQVRRAPLRRTDFERCLDTQTLAPDVPTQEQVVNKQWIIQNNAVPAWKQSCGRPPKVTNDWSEHAIVLLRLPTNQRMKRSSARDIALRAKGSNLLRRLEKGAAAAAVAAVRRCHLRPPPLAKRSLEQETEMTDGTGRVKEAKGASRSTSSRGQQ